MNKITLDMLSIQQLKQLQSELIAQITEISNIETRTQLHEELNAVSKTITARNNVISACGRNIGNITSISALEGINPTKLRH